MVEQSLKWELESDVKKLKTPGIPIVTDTGERTNPIFPEIRTISGAERLYQFTVSQNRPDFKCTSHVMLDHGAASFKGLFQSSIKTPRLRNFSCGPESGPCGLKKFWITNYVWLFKF